MATRSVSLIASDWTLVSSAFAGFMQNKSSNSVTHVAATAKPPASITDGHTLDISSGRGFFLNAGESLYARTLLQPGSLMLSE